MKKKKALIISSLILSLCMTGPALTAFSEEVDIDSMSIEELREAYQALAEENAALEEENKDLKAELYDLQNGNTEEESAESTPEEPEVKMNEDDFFKDILDSYNARQVVGDRYSDSEVNTLTEDELYTWYNSLVDTELAYMGKYEHAIFDDLNVQYLCGKYVNGLLSQKKACETYLSGGDPLKADNYWTVGYNARCYVVVELAEYYQIPFSSDDVSVMKLTTDALDSLNEAETRNAAVDHSVVQQTQELLNGIGFFCGNADGVSGKRTVKSIKRFQEMYGYEPVDGIIDDELIEQLQAVYDSKNAVSSIAEEPEVSQ